MVPWLGFFFFHTVKVLARACKGLGWPGSLVYTPVNKNDCYIFNNHKTNKNKKFI